MSREHGSHGHEGCHLDGQCQRCRRLSDCSLPCFSALPTQTTCWKAPNFSGGHVKPGLLCTREHTAGGDGCAGSLHHTTKASSMMTTHTVHRAAKAWRAGRWGGAAVHAERALHASERLEPCSRSLQALASRRKARLNAQLTCTAVLLTERVCKDRQNAKEQITFGTGGGGGCSCWCCTLRRWGPHRRRHRNRQGSPRRRPPCRPTVGIAPGSAMRSGRDPRALCTGTRQSACIVHDAVQQTW